MPLLASSNRGYADWQRVENWDTGDLWSASGNNVAVGTASPILDVSRSGYLGGYLTGSGVGAIFTATWYIDAAGTIPIGTRAFVLIDNILSEAQVRLPNLGPFVQLALDPLTNGNFSYSAQVFGTNRVHPLEFIPSHAALIEETNTPVPATSTLFYYPQDYYSGPVQVYTSPTGAVTVAIQLIDPLGNWYNTTLYTVAANANDTREGIAPPGAWRMAVVNGGGSSVNISLAVTPSMTGSS